MNRDQHFTMADIRRKRPSARRAVAVGEFHPGAFGFAALNERRLPKGDALVMAEIAGLQGAKLASSLMPLCHPLLLEKVQIRCVPDEEKNIVRVYCEVATFAKTGVEMEALAGVNAALLTLYDLTKPVEPALSICGIRLLFKEGGKKGLWVHPDGMRDNERAWFKPQSIALLTNVSTAVITLSDRATSGEYVDESGALLAAALENLQANIIANELLPDHPARIQKSLSELLKRGAQLIITTGGTGLGARDCTPESLHALGAREVPGIGELLRDESRHYTAMASLSRSVAVQIGGCLIIALPGSPKAVVQSMEILAPILAHAVQMMENKGHP